MKFTYQYKTSDGVRHTGTYAANSKTGAWHVKAWQEFAVRHGREISKRQVLDWMGAPSSFYMERIFEREIELDESAELTREKEAITTTMPRQYHTIDI